MWYCDVTMVSIGSALACSRIVEASNTQVQARRFSTIRTCGRSTRYGSGRISNSVYLTYEGDIKMIPATSQKVDNFHHARSPRAQPTITSIPSIIRAGGKWTNIATNDATSLKEAMI